MMTISDEERPIDRTAGPGVPARAWLRPALFTVLGLLCAGAQLVAHQWAGGIALALFAVFMGYWTSPVRAGQHTPFADAIQRRSPAHAIVLWAPGDPLSARLQTAIRGQRPDVTWVNVYRDADAEAFAATVGGRGAIPLVVIGERILRRATVGQYLDARADAERDARRRDRAGRSGEGTDDAAPGDRKDGP